MGELDHRLALELQREFEEPSHVHHDNQMARLLQEQFNHEVNIERPPSNLAYTLSSPKDKSKCLVDPSWELNDPTPNVHSLFIAFDKRFFGGKLAAVCVSWSKRMTSCAGICSYSHRGGLCKITLSEPLLKLRPRKDLVETLLHEMIHGYLFVTHNNRDRDGHGPEFHKHMYRINKEAGTNISVYHDFHDEVKLYKQHWWKCNGPCRDRKPFYGTVRRAMNRAPGPNDLWYAEHLRTCGGTFIKVKEPEKPAKPKKLPKKPIQPASPNKDIRSYYPTTNAAVPLILPNGKLSTVTNNGFASDNIRKPNQNAPSTATSEKNSAPNSALQNVTSLYNNGTTNKNKTFNDNTNIKNIHGFHDVGGSRVGNTTFNGGTVVINPKAKTRTTSEPDVGTAGLKVPNFSGSGHVLKPTVKSTESYEDVRSSWLNKFGDKRGIGNADEKPLVDPKRKRFDEEPMKEHFVLVNCPVCRKKIKDKELNEHLDNCLSDDSNSFDECFVCNKNVPRNRLEEHVARCLKSETIDGFDDDMSTTECTVCGEKIKVLDVSAHTKTCIQNLSAGLLNDASTFKECPECKTLVDDEIYDRHAAACLMHLFDEMDKTGQPVEMVACLVCKKEVPKDDLNGHLDECLNESIFLDDEEKNSFCEDNSLIEEFENGTSAAGNGEVFVSQNDVDCFINDTSLIDEYVNIYEKKYNCPVCSQSMLETELNGHLDMCLKET